MRISAAMENASLSSDVWNNVTTSSLQPDDLTSYLANIRDLALKVIYIIIGIVGVVDNLFVLVVFFLFIKITEKVLRNFATCHKALWQTRPTGLPGSLPISLSY